MIDQASRGPYKPGVSPKIGSADDVALHMPLASQDAEEAERGKAARTVVRMLLGRHNCPRLPACPTHGRELCDCHPCNDPRHHEGAAVAADAVRALGLDDGRGVGHVGA
jgi:hypothetical protein